MDEAISPTTEIEMQDLEVATHRPSIVRDFGHSSVSTVIPADEEDLERGTSVNQRLIVQDPASEPAAQPHGRNDSVTTIDVLEDEKQRGIHWPSPLSMVIYFIVGFVAALSHHFYYCSYNGIQVGNDVQQQWVLRFVSP